jgi:hypothetical protein
MYLRHEAKAHARSLGSDALEEPGPEGLHEAFARPERECSDELLDVDLFGGAKRRVCVVHESGNALAKLDSAWCGNETASSPD